MEEFDLNDLCCNDLGGQETGKDFPVFRVGDVEIAAARKERKVGLGHRAFDTQTQGVSLEEDLVRRDFRCNAMAMDPFTGEIFDPFGGRNDIQNGVLEVVGPHFCEDPLRVLRAARFAAQLGLRVAPGVHAGTLAVLEELQTLPGERVFMELEKALRTARPSIFFETLDELHVLDLLFPEIYDLKGRVQPEKYHPEGDAYVHTLLVIDRARELGADDIAMFTALTHDLGKAVTDDDNLPHHYNHEALGVPLVHKMSDRLKVSSAHRLAAATAAREHLNVHRFADLKTVNKVRLITRLRGLQDNLLLERVALAAQADAQGRGPELKEKPYPQRDMLRAYARVVRDVRGDQFVAIKDGRVIAQRMESARVKALHEAFPVCPK
jgi:tRNA nucleotidyltransferase (CCA-adding enzyme)